MSFAVISTIGMVIITLFFPAVRLYSFPFPSSSFSPITEKKAIPNTKTILNTNKTIVPLRAIRLKKITFLASSSLVFADPSIISF